MDHTGIVDEPGQAGRSFQMLEHKKGKAHISAETWLNQAPHLDGSWWPAWENWLATLSGDKISPPDFGNKKKGLTIICDAPGTYVLQK